MTLSPCPCPHLHILIHHLPPLLLTLGPREKAAPPTSQQIGHFPPKLVKYRHRYPFLFLFLPHPQESPLCSQPVRGKVRRTGRIFPEHAERRCLDPEHGFVAVRRIPRTRFAKQMFAQLRTGLTAGSCHGILPGQRVSAAVSSHTCIPHWNQSVSSRVTD